MPLAGNNKLVSGFGHPSGSGRRYPPRPPARRFAARRCFLFTRPPPSSAAVAARMRCTRLTRRQSQQQAHPSSRQSSPAPGKLLGSLSESLVLLSPAVASIGAPSWAVQMCRRPRGDAHLRSRRRSSSWNSRDVASRCRSLGERESRSAPAARNRSTRPCGAHPQGRALRYSHATRRGPQSSIRGSPS